MWRSELYTYNKYNMWWTYFFFKAFQNDNGLSAGMAQCWFLYSFQLTTNIDFFLKQDKPDIQVSFSPILYFF